MTDDCERELLMILARRAAEDDRYDNTRILELLDILALSDSISRTVREYLLSTSAREMQGK